ncbi:hypothetical protein [Streptomyces sp. CBMA123]|uniref:hypothetical protein n=1 Tax=Streptomyces sp. CBMA123 TaxID=1896313 RepID=UPI0021D520D6|nr:hypothetical protein [Streptomyces sp. CBMA123]
MCERVLTAVIDRTRPGTPSLVQQAAKFMLAFNNTAPFPTSLGTPAAPTPDTLEEALANTLTHILNQLEDIWAMA